MERQPRCYPGYRIHFPRANHHSQLWLVLSLQVPAWCCVSDLQPRPLAAWQPRSFGWTCRPTGLSKLTVRWRFVARSQLVKRTTLPQMELSSAAASRILRRLGRLQRLKNSMPFRHVVGSLKRELSGPTLKGFGPSGRTRAALDWRRWILGELGDVGSW